MWILFQQIDTILWKKRDELDLEDRTACFGSQIEGQNDHW